MGDKGAKNKGDKEKHKKHKLHSREKRELKRGQKKSEREQEYFPTTAMSIHAHPDDQEFTVAGTLAKWARQGCRVVSIIVTSGDAGSNESSRGAEYKSCLAHLREDEQIAANLNAGIRETAFLHYPDGELEASLQLRKDLARLIRQYRPEVVVTGDPRRVLLWLGLHQPSRPPRRRGSGCLCRLPFRRDAPDLCRPAGGGLRAAQRPETLPERRRKTGCLGGYPRNPGSEDCRPQAARQPVGRLGSHRDDEGMGRRNRPGKRAGICRILQGDYAGGG